MILDEKLGDLLKADESYIAQQCNCVTVKSHGLSLSIKLKYSWGDPYSTRAPISYGRNSSSIEDRDAPGTVRILSNTSTSASGVSSEENLSLGSVSSEPKIICLFAQWAPGKPGAYSHYYPSDHVDNASDRFGWFRQCLKCIDDDAVLDTPVAVPFNIGCGLAGGNWTDYREALDSADTKFIIYRL